jgi:hypothetical protein
MRAHLLRAIQRFASLVGGLLSIISHAASALISARPALTTITQRNPDT